MNFTTYNVQQLDKLEVGETIMFLGRSEEW